MKEYAILLDNTFSTGCNSCAYRCIQELQIPRPGGEGALSDLRSDQRRRPLPEAVHALPGAGLRRQLPCQGPDPSRNTAPSSTTPQTCIGCKTCTGLSVPCSPVRRGHKENTSSAACAPTRPARQDALLRRGLSTGALQFGEYKEILAKAKDMAAKGKLKLTACRKTAGPIFSSLSKTDPVVAGYPKVPGKDLKKGVSMGDAVAVPGPWLPWPSAGSRSSPRERPGKGQGAERPDRRNNRAGGGQ